MRGARLVLIAAAIAAVACGGDSTGPEGDPDGGPKGGTWVLESLGGKPLPAVVPSFGTSATTYRVYGWIDLRLPCCSTIYRVDSVAGGAPRTHSTGDLTFLTNDGVTTMVHLGAAWPDDTVIVSGDQMTVHLTQDNDGDGVSTLGFRWVSDSVGQGGLRDVYGDLRAR